MTLDQLERLEQTVMEMVVQALTDYREQAATIFREETDQPQDIAEDVAREALEAMGVSGIRERLYGKVDYKKAIYAFLPAAQAVALMLDAKAEKANGDRTATIQMSQTSMRVRMKRKGSNVDEAGKLDQVIRRAGHELYVVTVIAKFTYDEKGTSHRLRKIIVACIPNGMLQERYNPSVEDNIWLAGRNAPTLGEDFRVRLSYSKLREKSAWRVREIDLA
ncbi:MAG: SfiI family type II restriction endonuclease [Gammaproteobacteria bacterium]|nr:SfiI family type II restriction endonuclease [Gammaproteobacteria bacterium]